MNSNKLLKIKDFESGQQITSFFVVRKSELRTGKDNSNYLHLELGDSSGRIQANLWNSIQDFHKNISSGNIVKIQGFIRTYKENLQISINKIRLFAEKDGVTASDFIPEGNFNIETLWNKFSEKCKTINDPFLQKLLNHFFNDPELSEKFKKAPGGKLWHHAYLGGLLEHSLSVAEICDTLCRLYPLVNRNILITGALLHDIGKIDEYGFSQGYIDFTDQGRLWGHITIGAQLVEKSIIELENNSSFPEELKKNIIHLILSHQGELAHGSPVLPQTIEAIILYYCDEMDSKANAYKRIIERDSKPGKKWSQYINLIDRFIYLKDTDEKN